MIGSVFYAVNDFQSFNLIFGYFCYKKKNFESVNKEKERRNMSFESLFTFFSFLIKGRYILYQGEENFADMLLRACIAVQCGSRLLRAPSDHH